MYKFIFASLCQYKQLELTTGQWLPDLLAIRGRDDGYKNNLLNITIKIVNIIHRATHKKLKNNKVDFKYKCINDYIKKIR